MVGYKKLFMSSLFPLVLSAINTLEIQVIPNLLLPAVLLNSESRLYDGFHAEQPRVPILIKMFFICLRISI